MPPELSILLDRVVVKATQLQKTSSPEAIERMKVVRTSKHCLEARQQQHHRQDVLAVMGEDRIEDIGITVAHPREVAARDQTPRQVIRAMQVEHRLLDGLQRAVRQAWPENAAGQREEIEV